ncbi:amphi-Trp domain-containing protein [Nocardia sp. MW-W600-9]
MPKLEIKRKTELSRHEAAARLIAIGKALAGGSEVEYSSEGDSIEIVVADRVSWEFEIEVDGDETEIEIEIKWRDDPVESPTPAPSPRPKAAAPAKTTRRARARKTAAG